MTIHPIILETPPKEAHASTILHQLFAYNQSRCKDYDYARPYGFFIQDNGHIFGGAVGYLWIGTIRIERLFIDGEIRGQGYGSQLLEQIESFARNHSASLVILENLSFQGSLNFYLKHGYKVVLEEEGYTDETIMCKSQDLL